MQMANERFKLPLISSRRKILSPRRPLPPVTVAVPGSKSITNRALVLAGLAEGQSVISNFLISNDTMVMIAALENLGVALEADGQTKKVSVTGVSGANFASAAPVWMGDAGTVARFLIPACTAGLGRFEFDGSDRLRQRPIGALLETLYELGAESDPPGNSTLPLVLNANHLRGGRVTISAGQSSQFVSGLLIAAALADGPLEITVSDLPSRPYVHLTCEIMREFSVEVEERGRDRFYVGSNQRYKASNYAVEADASSASYFFAAAAVTGGEVSVSNISRNSSQGDIRFLDILEMMGCTVVEKAKGVTVAGPERLSGVTVDMSDISDTFPTLACIAPFAEEPVTITHIGHTRQQESDRISAVRMGLESLGVAVESGPDWIRVIPSEPTGGVIDSHDDHRIAMSFAVLGLRVEDTVIDGASCVRKTFPSFFDLWRNLEMP